MYWRLLLYKRGVIFRKTMKRTLLALAVVTLFCVMFGSCSQGKVKLEREVDSLSYVIGMNVGYNLMKMDSTLNIEVLCEAIRDVYNGTTQMTMEKAREYYLAEKTYFVHERAKAHQEQYLSDLAARNRQYVRTRTGVTYKIEKLGDQSHVGSMTVRDTVKFAYTLTDEQGRVIVEADTLRDSYRNIVKGLQEVVKLAGDGAHFNAWLPSSVAYGVEGNKELGIAGNTLLNYDVKVLDIKYNR